MTISSQLFICWHLFRREMMAYKKLWKASMIDNVIIATMFALACGYFLPAMGMPLSFCMPIFLGSVMVLVISLSYAAGITLSFDNDGAQLFRSFLALPVGIHPVVCTLIIGSVVRSLLTLLPVLILGCMYMNDWSALSVSYSFAPFAFVLVSLFWNILFLFCAFWLRKEAMMSDIWPRCIGPLFSFGCVFYPWHTVSTHAPRVAQWMLFNPVTQSVEIIRSVLLPSQHYIPYSLSATFLSGGCFIMYGLLIWAIKKRLRPVVKRYPV